MKLNSESKTIAGRRSSRESGLRSIPWRALRLDHEEQTACRLGIDRRPRLIFVTEGAVEMVKPCHNGGKAIRHGEMMLIPAGKTLALRSLEPSHIVICPLDRDAGCCPSCTALNMARLLSEPGGSHTIPFGELIANLLELVAKYLNDGIREPKLYELKRSELLFLLYVQMEKLTGRDLMSCR